MHRDALYAASGLWWAGCVLFWTTPPLPEWGLGLWCLALIVCGLGVCVALGLEDFGDEVLKGPVLERKGTGSRFLDALIDPLAVVEKYVVSDSTRRKIRKMRGIQAASARQRPSRQAWPLVLIFRWHHFLLVLRSLKLIPAGVVQWSV